MGKVYAELVEKSDVATAQDARSEVERRNRQRGETIKIEGVRSEGDYWLVTYTGHSGEFDDTPHEEERAEAAEEIAEAAADVAEESVEEATEHVTELEEAVGEVEEAIPDDAPPEVKLNILTALENMVAAAEEALAVARAAENVAEEAEAVAEDPSSDVEETHEAAEVATEAAAVAEVEAEVAEHPAPESPAADEMPDESHWYFRDLLRRRRVNA